MVFSSNEYYNGPLLDLFARHYWLVNVATYSTVLIEIAYPFLIWQRATRPYLLAAAIMLHVEFAVFMGLFYFSFVMIDGASELRARRVAAPFRRGMEALDGRHGNDL